MLNSLLEYDCIVREENMFKILLAILLTFIISSVNAGAYDRIVIREDADWRILILFWLIQILTGYAFYVMLGTI